MKKTHYNSIQSLVLAATLSAGLGFGSPVSAQEHSYIVDLNSKTITELGTLGGAYTYATLASTTPGRWWGGPIRLQVSSVPLLLAPMAWA